jgi:Cd2+/Zn2+-exporting ATPase
MNPMPRIFEPKGELIGASIAGVLLALGIVLHAWLKIEPASGFYWLALAVGLVFGVKAAWDAIREGEFNIDVLMAVAAILAASIGHPGEGALLLFLFSLSGALEGLAMERTQREVSALHALMPAEALVLRGGDWVPASAESLLAGETIKVRPGERVPADAVVTSGATSMDQSAITGESLLRDVKAGDELYAGTINTDDAVEASVLRPASESSLQKILDLVTRAREQREPAQRAIDRLSQPYSIGVVVLSLVIMLVWWKVLGRPLLGDAEHAGAISTAITFLIVASPCALVIATPTATLAAIARGARAGVLFKGGDAINRLSQINSMALDKTGTLTFGRPRLYEVHPVAWSDGASLLAVAAGLESDSTHPIASAIRDGAKQRGVTPLEIENIDHVTARGLSGITDGHVVRLGRWSFVKEVAPVCLHARVEEVLGRIQERGHIGVVVARADASQPESGEAAVLIMADAVRPGASELTPSLHQINITPVRMLTGDNASTAHRVGASIGLDQVDADLLPEDKLRIISTMKSQGRRVAFVGDGVNDAPALATAHVSMAIGTIGTAAALESADIVLLSENLSPIPWSIELARACRRIVKLNITIAIGIIVLMGLATLTGSAIGREVPMSIGVIAHEGGTVVVVLNSLFLLAIRGWVTQLTTKSNSRSTIDKGIPVDGSFFLEPRSP